MMKYTRVCCAGAIIVQCMFLRGAAQDTPIGFGAAVTGGSGSPVVVTSFNAFKSAVEKGGKIVQVNAVINGGDGSVSVRSNTTIIGLNNSGITRCNVRMRGVSNIIMKDVFIHDAKKGTCADDESGGDLVTVENSSRLWFDHCEFANPEPNWSNSSGEKNCRDGMLDIRGSSSAITISYTYFHDHWKGLLIGSSSSDNPGSRTITMHHNYLRNMGSRLPSYRGGILHFFNNYMRDAKISGINSREGACAKIEGNVFETSRNPISSLDYSKIGYWDVKDNIFTKCTFSGEFTQADVEKSTKTCSISYTYTVEPSSAVVASVLSSVGPSWKEAVAVRPFVSGRLPHKSATVSAMYTIRGEKIASASRAMFRKANGIYLSRENDKTVVRINPVY